MAPPAPPQVLGVRRAPAAPRRPALRGVLAGRRRRSALPGGGGGPGADGAGRGMDS